MRFIPTDHFYENNGPAYYIISLEINLKILQLEQAYACIIFFMRG